MTSLAGLGIDRRAVSVSLTRRAAGVYSTADATFGEWVPGTPTTTTILATVQPASGRRLEDLPEGLRAEARWLAWSRAELCLDDVIAHGGLTYRVMFVWPRVDGGFWRAALGQLAAPISGGDMDGGDGAGASIDPMMWVVFDVDTPDTDVVLPVVRNRVIRLTLSRDVEVSLNAGGHAATEFLSFVLKVVQGEGAPYQISWHDSIRWAGAYAPSLNQTAAGEDLFQFMSWDGGASWHGGRIVQFGG